LAAILLTKPHPIHPEQFILTFNTGLKFKMYNSESQMCRKTVLGPSYTDDIKDMKQISSLDNNNYLAFSSSKKVVGLIKLPLDGNPHKTMGLIAHPLKVSNMASSYNGNFLMTAGGPDKTVFLWLLNPAFLENQIQIAGEGLKPYLNMLDDSGLGDKGPAYRELEDYFYYAQLRR
jgi:WD40 repeat protein